jgi:hypothetical protein
MHVWAVAAHKEARQRPMPCVAGLALLERGKDRARASTTGTAFAREVAQRIACRNQVGDAGVECRGALHRECARPFSIVANV